MDSSMTDYDAITLKFLHQNRVS